MILLVLPSALAAPDVAAQAGRPPQLLNGQKIVGYDDYPELALRQGTHGIVTVLLRISTGGRVLSCDVTESSGSDPLDAQTCTLNKARARFRPALDADGIAMIGEYRASTSWGIGADQPTTSASIAAQVSFLPPEYKHSPMARLLFGPDGNAVGCEIMASSGSTDADHAACGYAVREMRITPPLSRSAAITALAVRYVTVRLATR